MRQPLKHQFQNELEKCPVVKYVVETLKLLPEMPELIFIEQAIARVAQLGRVNYAVNPV